LVLTIIEIKALLFDRNQDLSKVTDDVTTASIVAEAVAEAVAVFSTLRLWEPYIRAPRPNLLSSPSFSA
jgi:hypothetical protein